MREVALEENAALAALYVCTVYGTASFMRGVCAPVRVLVCVRLLNRCHVRFLTAKMKRMFGVASSLGSAAAKVQYCARKTDEPIIFIPRTSCAIDLQ